MQMKLNVVAFILFITSSAYSQTKVEIVEASGGIFIRRGVEETWQPALPGASLEEIDSILTGENASVTLKIHDGQLFKLGANSILDIFDLRQISEREMFLYLMSKKIDGIAPREEKTRLKIGNVHVVHGELKSKEANSDKISESSGEWQLEKNGAWALFEQNLLTNAVVKLSRIIQKYPELQDCGELHFRLGQVFEALSKKGQAIDAYQAAQQAKLGDCSTMWRDRAETALGKMR